MRLYGPATVDLPPRVAEMRRWVPYFLMMVSMNCWVVGLLPSSRMLLWNSGMRGMGWRTRSLLSMAVFLTFQRANSLGRRDGRDSQLTSSIPRPSPPNQPIQASLPRRESACNYFKYLLTASELWSPHSFQHHEYVLGTILITRGFPGSPHSRKSATIQETWVQLLRREDPLEEGMAIHSTIPAWRIPWIRSLAGYTHTYTGLQRVGHDWMTNTFSSLGYCSEPERCCHVFKMLTEHQTQKSLSSSCLFISLTRPWVKP